MTNYNVVNNLQDLITDEKILHAFEWDANFPSIIDIDVINLMQYLSCNQEDFYAEEYFFDDVIVSLLNDAVIEIIEYFNGTAKKTKIKKNPILVNEFFYDETTFFNILDEYLNQLKISDVERKKVHDKIVHIEDIHMQMPKITFPWSFFILSFTAQYEGKKLDSLKRRLSLKWTSSNKPNESEVFQNAQKDFKTYIDFLKFFTVDVMKVNQSLNLFAFNEVTNLYDLYNLINKFKEDSNYMDLITMQNKVGEIIDEIRYDYKKRALSGYTDMAKFCALETKTIMTDELENPILFQAQEYQDLFNRVFLGAKNSLREFILKRLHKHDKIEHIPEEIKNSYAIYQSFLEFEPYKYILDDVFEADINIHKPSSNDMEEENHLYEAYGLAYKMFYDAKKK